MYIDISHIRLWVKRTRRTVQSECWLGKHTYEWVKLKNAFSLPPFFQKYPSAIITSPYSYSYLFPWQYVSTLKFHHWNVYIQSTSISTALALKLLLEELSSPLHSVDELHKCLPGTCFISLPSANTGVLTQDYINTSNIWYILIPHNKVNKPNSCDVNHTGPKLVQIQDLYRNTKRTFRELLNNQNQRKRKNCQ